MGVAGLRALLLESLHPVVMTAFSESGWGEDLWTRLARTAEYVGVVTYGSTTQAMLAGSRVRAVHARVQGTMPDGIPYAAEDPQLLSWVHSCHVASFLEIVTRGGLRLSAAEQDAYIAEQVKAAMLVGLEPDEVPHDRAGLQDYFRVIRPVLEATPAARRAAAAVVSPPLASAPPLIPPRSTGTGSGSPATSPPAWASVAGLAFATLPPWGRRLYGLSELPGAAGLTDAAATVGLQTLRTALKGTPGAPEHHAGPPWRGTALRSSS
jgi:uncharacterized protein (DUF2236 family)